MDNEQKNPVANQCQPLEASLSPLDDQIKRREIDQAIQDLDGKLTELEKALHMDEQNNAGQPDPDKNIGDR